MGALCISLEVRTLGRLDMSIGLTIGPDGAWGRYLHLHFGDTCVLQYFVEGLCLELGTLTA
jgi:hypothetical protein